MNTFVSPFMPRIKLGGLPDYRISLLSLIFGVLLNSGKSLLKLLMQQYLTFALRQRRFLSFGVSMTFFSSFGQTFLISLFVPYFLHDFSLSNTGFGTLYASATLMSAVTLPWLGKWIDHLPLRTYSMLVAAGLLVASTVLFTAHSVYQLFAALYLLRASGQGLTTHTAQTAMARAYDSERGRALSITSLGYPLGEGLLPLGISAILGIWSWRSAWALIIAIILIGFIPLLYWLQRGDKLEAAESDHAQQTKKKEDTVSPFSYLKDRRFWLVMPATVVPPFWLTGLFLYQMTFAGQIGWASSILAAAFVGFAAARILMSIAVGPMIDSMRARNVFPFYLIPFGIGLMVPLFHAPEWASYAYMFMLGVTMGMGSNVKSALYAEVFGTEHLGTVRSLFSSVMVFSTAASPFLMGWMLDHNVPIQLILSVALASVIGASVLAWWICKSDLSDLK